MRYLITGGAGFIGSHLVDRLIADGHSVDVYDNLSTGSLDNVRRYLDHPRFELCVGDILDFDRMRPFAERADRIVHLAAAVGVRLIMEKPVETITTNVGGTEVVLKLASEREIPVLIASTSEVYGKLQDTEDGLASLGEDSDWRLGPTSKRRWAYACSKAMDEFLALAYADEKQLPVICARFFNTVGPRQSGEYGMVIPRFVQRAMLGEPIVVYGDGDQSRCFNHVADAVEGVVRLLNEPKAYGEVFNVGNTNEITIGDLARRVRELSHSDSEIQFVPFSEVFAHGFEDMRRRTPDLTKIHRLVGYQPKHSIDEIIMSVIDYFKHNSVPI
ncbi:MAG: GDP-mannose 4,6-dehydratase [Gemmatimonadaceae bacterium]|nr:GDP-mannose 4,6-dehydratase [Gemmatimonadaceae bacterium]